MNKGVSRSEILKDVAYVLAGLLVAWVGVSAGALDVIFSATHGMVWLESIIAGIFFTSSFTIAIAAIALVDIAHLAPPLEVALWGATGAMLGDLVMFLFVQRMLPTPRSTTHTKTKKKSRFHHTILSTRLGLMRVLSLLLGALIIASPLPDELGLAMMGLSRIRAWYILPIAFVMNFLGILAVVAVADVVIIPLL